MYTIFGFRGLIPVVTSGIAVPDVDIYFGDGLAGADIDVLNLKVERDTRLSLSHVLANHLAEDVVRAIGDLWGQDTASVGGKDRGLRGLGSKVVDVSHVVLDGLEGLECSEISAILLGLWKIQVSTNRRWLEFELLTGSDTTLLTKVVHNLGATSERASSKLSGFERGRAGVDGSLGSGSHLIANLDLAFDLGMVMVLAWMGDDCAGEAHCCNCTGKLGKVDHFERM